MPRLIKQSLTALFCLSLAACHQNPALEQLQSMEMQDDVYTQQLAELYQTYAETAEAAQRYDAAVTFAQKGLDAASGEAITPFRPKAVEPKKLRRQLATMRKDWKGTNTAELRDIAPRAAAGSLFFYDCMIDQHAEPDSPEYSYCNEQWSHAMADLKNAQSRLDAQKIEPLINRYIVYFALDDYSLSSMATQSIQLLHNEIRNYKERSGKEDINVTVNGHADTSGSNRHNMVLSNNRADSVKSMLVSLGMVPEAIATFGYGETDLAVPTPDETYEPKNRRVEIVVE